MSTKPLVSVVIPTYNCPFLSEAINSVLTQTYENIEIIIIDDGSTDKTRVIVEKYHTKVQYIYQENQGVSSARNNGIRASHGDYIAFLDADDVWLPAKLKNQIDIFNENDNIGFVYCDNYFVNESLRPLSNYSRKIPLFEGDILINFLLDYFIITSGLVVKRECFSSIGYFSREYIVDEDFEFFLRLVQKYSGGVVKNKLFLRRIYSMSLSRQDFQRNAAYDIQILEEFISKNQNFYKENRKILNRRLADLYFLFGYRYLIRNKNLHAFIQFLHALKCNPQIKIIKNILLCFIPKYCRKYLKKFMSKTGIIKGANEKGQRNNCDV